MVEEIKYKEELMAIVIRNNHDYEGIQFLTPGDFSQQLAYMRHPTGHVIVPHFHNQVIRTIHYTQEVLVIKKGKLQVDFYDNDKRRITSSILGEGDIILLCSGGHGFNVLEEVSMVEVKQGPYVGENDKTRFEPLEGDVDEKE